MIKRRFFHQKAKEGNALKEFTVEKEEYLKEFTDNVCAQASFCFRSLLKNKEIRVNGVKTGENILLQKGDEVRYYMTAAQENKAAFYPVFEDENVFIVDKESGVNSEAVFSELKEKGCKFIHRLDRNTKGLLIFAKTAAAEEELLSLFKTRKMKKTYHALCVGKFQKNHEVLTAYLLKDEKRASVKIYKTQVPKSEKIITEYTVLKELDGYTMVEVILHTGKTHQIRAHLAYLGNPVLGDNKYGDEKANERQKSTRQRLVSKTLTLQSEGFLQYLNGKTFYSRFTVDE